MLNAMPFAFGCPTLVLAQSNRESQKDKHFKLPHLDGLKGTSELESAARAVVSLWMPARSEGYKANIDAITLDGIDYLVTDDMVIVGIMKQKHNPYPIIKPCRIDFTKMEFDNAYVQAQEHYANED